MDELTLEEMQEKLKNYCRSVSCDECPFTFRYDCHYIINGDNFAETKEGYDLVFGNKDKDKMKKEFTKADLKNRMVVELRNGERRLFVGDGFIGFGGWNKKEAYDNDLLHIHQSNWDIVKVLQPISFFKDLNNSFLETVWQRPEPKKMTKIEIEKELGYEIEIIE